MPNPSTIAEDEQIILEICPACNKRKGLPIHAWLKPGAGPEIGAHYACMSCHHEFDIMRAP